MKKTPLLLLLATAALPLGGQTTRNGLLPPSAPCGATADALCATTDSEGFLWTGREKGGLCRLDGHATEAFRSDRDRPDLLRSNDVTCLAETADGGSILFGTKNGAYSLRKATLGIRPLMVRGAEDGGRELADKRINYLLACRDGTAWVAYRNHVLHVSADFRLLDRFVLRWRGRDRGVAALYEDSAGSVWACLWNGGLCRRKKAERDFAPRPWEQAGYPTCIVEDGDGRCYWVGTSAGAVVRLDADDGRQPPAAAAATPDGQPVWGMEYDGAARRLAVRTPQGTLAFDTRGGTLRPLPARGRPAPLEDGWRGDARPAWLAEAESTLDGRVLSFAEGRGGSRYIGTFDALYLLERGTGRAVRLAGGIGRVHDIGAASDGTVYFVSNGKGLCALREGAHRVLLDRKSLSCLAIDSADVWVGSSIGQVFRIDRKSGAATETPRAGNENGDAVKRLRMDSGGHLWVLSARQVKEYQPRDGGARTTDCRQEELRLAAFDDMAATAEGIAVRGGGKWFLLPHTAEMDAPVGNVRARVSYYIVGGRRRLMPPGGSEIRLARGEEELEVGLTTLEYDRPQDVRLAYRTGGGGEWTELPKGAAAVSLRGVGGGRTELEVKATDAFGRWGRPAVVATVVRPVAWHKRTGVRVLVGGAAVLLGLGLHAWGRRRRRKGLPAGAPPTEDAPEAAPAPLSPADRELVERARAAVEKNMDNAAYSVDAMSADMLMSRMNLYRRLREATGQAPTDFIRNIRLERAAHLLRHSSHSVNEVADLVGFAYASYFAKCFKERFGVSPKDYQLGKTPK